MQPRWPMRQSSQWSPKAAVFTCPWGSPPTLSDDSLPFRTLSSPNSIQWCVYLHLSLTFRFREPLGDSYPPAPRKELGRGKQGGCSHQSFPLSFPRSQIVPCLLAKGGRAKGEQAAAPRGPGLVWMTERGSMPANECMREHTLRGESEGTNERTRE